MPQSLAQIYIHLVFHIRKRSPLIRESEEQDLHAYLGGILRELECKPIVIGGTENHIHILTDMSRRVSLSDLVRRLKTASHRYLVKRDCYYQNFAWQRGYGAFSLSFDRKEAVRHYISRQKEHHEVRSAEEEYIQMLQRANIDFNESYLWE